MEKLLMFMMILVSILSLWVKDVEIFIMDRAYRTVQYSIEHAVHDAALHVDLEALSEGRIVFLQPIAEEKILDSLQMNLDLNDQLRPNSLTLIDGPVTVDEIIYFDETYIDPKTAAPISFPYRWSYVIPVTGEVEERIIFGPSVGLVIDVKVKGEERFIKKLAIQEYKMYE